MPSEQKRTAHFDAKSAAQRSLEMAAGRNSAEQEEALRKKIRGRRIDWDGEFAKQRKAAARKEPEPFSKLNKHHPWRVLIGAIRLSQASAAFNKQHAPRLWFDSMQNALVGLRAELMAIAERIEASHPNDAELLRKLMEPDRPAVLTDEELDYECGRMDVNMASRDGIPGLLADTGVSLARRVGRKDQAAELLKENAE